MLWELKNKHRVHREKRNYAWLQICKQMEPKWESFTNPERLRSEEDIRKRWRYMRDRFIRDHAQQEKSGSSPSKKRKMNITMTYYFWWNQDLSTVIISGKILQNKIHT
ncbi:hypothetical protein GDO81_002764 [Engystomops pustulosus]|uniref:MADF domain-containing protein n=1 Tax=Engystomops pustulosus TaxID=76066 RepID=A0AAV7DQF0_ENGPU|nr:hypothetical protein GDO81_002764 [Engystomops pustulosus]